MLAAVTSRPLGRSRPAHRQVYIYLAIYATLDLLRGARAAFDPKGPYEGVDRTVFHLDQAALLVGPIGLAYLSALAFLGPRTPRLGHILGAAALIEAALIVTYPQTSGPLLGIIYACVYAISQLIVWGCAGWWLHRHRGDWPDETGKVVLALAAADLALLVDVLPLHVFDHWEMGHGARAAILLWICWHQAAWHRSTMGSARIAGAG